MSKCLGLDTSMILQFYDSRLLRLLDVQGFRVFDIYTLEISDSIVLRFWTVNPPESNDSKVLGFHMPTIVEFDDPNVL